MSKENLADESFQKIAEKLARGEKPEGMPNAIRLYKHPVEKRTITQSNAQIRDTRR
jgi:hypothetical protein